MTMFDLDELARWDEALERLAHTDTQETKTARRAARANGAAPLREVEDA